MKLEVFFDYACPYCERGYDLLTELLPDFPGIEAEWIPCEAHPRPETHGLHSDLCARGMYQAEEQGVDIAGYHKIMYRACIHDHVNIEDLDVIADLVRDVTDRTAYYEGLKQGNYRDRLADNNNRAWGLENFPAVPSLRSGSLTLPAIPGIGLRKEEVRQFLQQAARTN